MPGFATPGAGHQNRWDWSGSTGELWVVEEANRCFSCFAESSREWSFSAHFPENMGVKEFQ